MTTGRLCQYLDRHVLPNRPLLVLSGGGDNAHQGKAIIAAVESDEPPAFLLLGNDALSNYRRLAAATLQTIAAWEHLATSTDIDT